MNAYDKAYDLARSIQQSEEYQKYVETREKLQQNDIDNTMLQDFRRQQLELQIAELSGEEIEGKKEQLEKIYQILSLNPAINEFLTAEYRFARLMSDIQKILGESLDLWVDFDMDKKHVN